MANPLGNPDIAKIGKNYRFGQPLGPDPSQLAKEKNPQSVRLAIRRLAAAEVDITKPFLHKDILRMFGRKGTRITMAQALVAQKFQKALEGDVKAMQQLEDAVDGKLTEKTTEAQVTLADLVNSSFEYDE